MITITVRDTLLLSVYRAVDKAIGDIIGAALDSDSIVVIFSAHGMMKDHNQAHLVRPLLDRLNRKFTTRHMGLQQNARTSLVRYMRDLVPACLQHVVGDMVSDRIRQWVVEQEIIDGLEWSRTPGFALRTDIRTEIRLNLAGRESHGMLQPGSMLHHDYVDWIREMFLGLVDCESGAHLVDEIVQPQELFPGPYATSLPDLVVTWRHESPAHQINAPHIGKMSFVPAPVRGGDHTDQGFAVLLGDDDDTEALPSLRRTDEFATFFTELVERSRLRGRTHAPLP